jgi:nucleoid-associated protein YgaU
MGFIDFMRNVGTEIFGNGKKTESQAIKDHIDKDLNRRIENLLVVYNAGSVTLTGRAPTQADKEKAILIAGNVNGVEKVNGDGIQVTTSSPSETRTSPSENTSTAATIPTDSTVTTKFYTVEKGDNLSAIAKKVYNDASKYEKIFEANREVIKNPDLIYPGQKLRIPDQLSS